RRAGGLRRRAQAAARRLDRAAAPRAPRPPGGARRAARRRRALAPPVRAERGRPGGGGVRDRGGARGLGERPRAVRARLDLRPARRPAARPRAERRAARGAGAVSGADALEFWFEFASTYSYPAAMRIEERARAAGVPLRWKAFLLGPIFAAQGWNDSPFNLYPVKSRYMWRDLERVCAALELPMRRPSRFPRNGLRAARIACWFEDEPWLPAFVRAVYDANFARDADIAEPQVLAACL